MRMRSPKTHALGLALLVSSLVPASPAAAQITVDPLGASPLTGGYVYSAFAWDDKHNVYLHVWEFNRDLWGRFIDANGVLLGQNFIIGTYKLSFAGSPKVAYSRGNYGVDEFIVVYASDAHRFDLGSNIFAQRVQYTGQAPTGGALVGPTIFVSPNSSDGMKVQKPNAVTFNPVTGQFLIAYEEYFSEGPDAMVRLFAADGSAVTNAIDISNGGFWQGNSALDFDWQRNRFLMVYQGENPLDPTQLGMYGHLLDGGTALPITPQIPVVSGPAGVIDPAITYLPERDGFLVTWTSFDPDRNIRGRFVPSTYSGTLPDGAFGIFVTPGAQETTAKLAYDFASRYVMVSAMTDPVWIRSVVLDAQGVPQTAPFVTETVTPVSGSFNPVILPSEGGIFGLAYIIDYAWAVFERFQLPPASEPGPCYNCGPPPPPPGQLYINIDVPSAPANVANPFLLSGWAVDTRAPAGTGNGVDYLIGYAVPDSGAPAVSLGLLPVFYHRDDVAAFFGAQFVNSGFAAMVAHLFPGTSLGANYTLLLYPHSTVTGQIDYDHVAVRQIHVSGTSGVYTQVDAPGWGALLTNGGVGSVVAGWAVNLGSQSGPGVTGVHVWAVNAVTGEPYFVGAASYGLWTPIIGLAFGPQFAYSGFSATIQSPLPPGYYYILAYSMNLDYTFNYGRLGFAVIQ